VSVLLIADTSNSRSPSMAAAPPGSQEEREDWRRGMHTGDLPAALVRGRV